MRRMKAFLAMAIIAIASLIAQPVCADSGPKPTLEIIVENPEDDKYYLDLLGKEGEYGYFNATDGNDAYNHLHDQPIYKYDEDGWKAIHMRTWLLYGKLTGEPLQKDQYGNIIEMRHFFSYVGVPKEFKIIIQKSDGSIQVSDIIKNNTFNTTVRYDMGENKVLSVDGSDRKKGLLTDNEGQMRINEIIKGFILRLLLTLAIEELIAVPVFFRQLQKVSAIAFINIITQICLTAAMLLGYPAFSILPLGTGYFAALLIGEILVFVAEYLYYLRRFGKEEKRKILWYTAGANLASLAAGFCFPF